jgi:hypothetical protein
MCNVALDAVGRQTMTIRRLERSDWGGFCIRASRGLLGKQVEIEVASLQIGLQLEARRLPLLGMAYDPKGDVLELLIGELDHLIRAPRELYVDKELLGIVSFQIIDAEGVRQIATLRDPLMLPGPQVFRE